MTEEEKAALAAKEAAEEAARKAAEEAAKKKEEEKGDELKQFTQAQIDEMIKKAKSQATKKYADYDDLKAQLDKIEAERKQKELDEMSELERLKKQLEDKENEISGYAKEKKSAEIKAAFEKAARALDVPDKYLEDARILAGINEGTDVATIEETVKTLVENKPFLVEKKEGQQKEIGGASNGDKDKKRDKSKEQLLQEAADKARKTQRVEDKIAYVALKRELG